MGRLVPGRGAAYHSAMAPMKTRPRKTAEDYRKLPDDVLAELIDGEIFMSPNTPTRHHQQVVGNLYIAIRTFVESRKLGVVYVSPLEVQLPTGDIVHPDLTFVSEANREILKTWVEGSPDLHVEVISPTSAERDRFVKRDRYARSGVKEYWLVDMESRTVEVLVLEGGLYVPRGYFEEADTLVSPGLPGFALPVRKIFD